MKKKDLFTTHILKRAAILTAALVSISSIVSTQTAYAVEGKPSKIVQAENKVVNKKDEYKVIKEHIKELVKEPYELKIETMVPQTKVWKFEFDDEVNPKSLKLIMNRGIFNRPNTEIYNGSKDTPIKVIDEDGCLKPLNFKVKQNKVIVTPAMMYELGKTYALIIEKGILNKENCSLMEQPICIIFKVNLENEINDEPEILFENQTSEDVVYLDDKIIKGDEFVIKCDKELSSTSFQDTRKYIKVYDDCLAKLETRSGAVIEDNNKIRIVSSGAVIEDNKIKIDINSYRGIPLLVEIGKDLTAKDGTKLGKDYKFYVTKAYEKGLKEIGIKNEALMNEAHSQGCMLNLYYVDHIKSKLHEAGSEIYYHDVTDEGIKFNFEGHYINEERIPGLNEMVYKLTKSLFKHTPDLIVGVTENTKKDDNGKYRDTIRISISSKVSALVHTDIYFYQKIYEFRDGKYSLHFMNFKQEDINQQKDMVREIVPIMFDEKQEEIENKLKAIIDTKQVNEKFTIGKYIFDVHSDERGHKSILIDW
jgi:hypothetical protein